MRRLFTLFCFVPLLAIAADMPDGWKLPSERDLSQYFREKSPEKYALVDADFNGDAKTDYAYILKSTEFDGEGLLVKLSSNEGYVWKTINKINRGSKEKYSRIEMGIRLAEPGEHKTVCAYGYDAGCKADDPKSIKLESSGIWYFQYEAYEVLVYWDANDEKFKNVLVAD